MRKGISFFLNIILTALLLAVLVLCVVPVKSKAIARMAFLPFEKKFQNKIAFSSSSIWFPGNVYLEDVSITDKSGRLYYSKTADIKYNLIGLLFRKGGLSFDLKDIRFYGNIGILDSMADILIISKMPGIEFEEISGFLQVRNGTVYMRDIYAHNDSMRIKGGGWIDKNGLLDCDISFSFSRAMTDKVPDVVKETLLKRESKGWMSISFKARGNYKKPSLHLSGDRLKVNITEGLFGDE